MRWTTTLAICGATLVALHFAAERAWPASQVQAKSGEDASAFPEVKASNLEGKEFLIPKDLEGEVNLCLIAFQREQQKDIDTWLTGAKSLRDQKGFAVYELPTIAKATPVFRAWLDNVMRQGIADKEQREHTITLYLDKKSFCKSLKMTSEQTIYAILTDKKGAIVWRSEGRYTPEKGVALKEAIGRKLVPTI